VSARRPLPRWLTPESIGLDWSTFMAAKNKELERLNGVYLRLLAGAGVDYVEGRGKIVGPHLVEVDGKRFTVGRSKCLPCALCWIRQYLPPPPGQGGALFSS
jgi:pyruvate/2-oxoglutarate dehydrogenase complex dihydrolipoamide dehydrogenase (E3) component